MERVDSIDLLTAFRQGKLVSVHCYFVRKTQAESISEWELILRDLIPRPVLAKLRVNPAKVGFIKVFGSWWFCPPGAERRLEKLEGMFKEAETNFRTYVADNIETIWERAKRVWGMDFEEFSDFVESFRFELHWMCPIFFEGQNPLVSKLMLEEMREKYEAGFDRKLLKLMKRVRWYVKSKRKSAYSKTVQAWEEVELFRVGKFRKGTIDALGKAVNAVRRGMAPEFPYDWLEALRDEVSDQLKAEIDLLIDTAKDYL